MQAVNERVCLCICVCVNDGKREREGDSVKVGIGADFLEPAPTCPLTTYQWSDQPHLSKQAMMIRVAERNRATKKGRRKKGDEDKG